MLPLSKLVWNSVGKKFIMALTGLAMVFFLIEHVSGNLLLFNQSNPDPYNKYSDFLLGFGEILIVAELILVAFLLLHVFSGLSVARSKKLARPEKYAVQGNAGGPSRKNFASKTMIYTGLLTLVFIVIHLQTFKYGPNYTTMTADGAEVRDLHRLVWETFRNPIYVAWYVGALAFLFFHLRHGFWSAFQSLGVSHPRYSRLIYGLGIFLAVAVTAGFIGIPIWIYFTGA